LEDDIKITIINESFVRVDCDPGIFEELTEYFTFMSDNYKFHPLYKKKIWDGRISLLNRKTKLLPRGLAIYLPGIAKDRGYSCSFKEESTNFSLKDAEYFASTLKLQSKGNSIESKDYQLSAFQKAISNKRRLILSPTASGKSLLIYLIVRFLLEHECERGILIVPSISLVHQMFKDFKDYSVNNKWDVEGKCHLIFGGQDKKTNKELCISTWQSLAELKDPVYFHRFDFVIADEAHGAGAKVLTAILNNMVNARYRIGTTGTVKDTEVHILSIEGHFGPKYVAATTKQLMDRGDISKLAINFITLQYPTPVREIVSKMNYQGQVDYIMACEQRNKFIIKLANSLQENTLILFDRIEAHGDILYKMMKEKVSTDRKVFYVHGATEVEDRELVRQLTETEKGAIIIASLGVFSTGISINNLHNVVFARIGKSKIKIIQSIGRSLRKHSSKETATLYDISDNFIFNNKVNYSIDHAQERYKLYSDEQFTINKYKVPIDVK